MSSAGTLGVGIIGLSARGGWAGRSHVPALARVPGIEVVSCSSSSLAAAQVAAEKFGVPRAHEDAACLILDPRVDVVLVSVKVPEHRDMVMAALQGGKDVYCEWPLAVTRAEAEEMAQAARELGRLAVVGLQSRMSPPLSRIGELLSEGVIGTVRSSVLTGYGLMSGAVQPERSSYQLDSHNGATIQTIPMAHCLDAMAHVLGQWHRVSGSGVVAHPKVHIVETGEQLASDSVDHVSVAGTLGEGVIASLLVQPGLPSWGQPGLRWELTGSDGVMEITGGVALPQMTELHIRIRSADGEREVAWDELSGGVVEPFQVALVKTWEAVRELRVGEHRGPTPATFEDALQLHELLDHVGGPAVRVG